MRWLSKLRRRARLIVDRASVEREMRDEMHFHLEMEAEELTRFGAAESEARGWHGAGSGASPATRTRRATRAAAGGSSSCGRTLVMRCASSAAGVASPPLPC